MKHRPFTQKQTHRWLLTLLSATTMTFGLACHFGAPQKRVLPKGQIPLKVITLVFGDPVYGYQISPLNGEAFQPPRKPKKNPQVVPFDPKQPFPRTCEIVWTRDHRALTDPPMFSDIVERPFYFPDWENTNRVSIPGPLPANPEHILIVLYPNGTAKAEILNQAQVDGGRIQQVRLDYQREKPLQETKR